MHGQQPAVRSERARSRAKARRPAPEDESDHSSGWHAESEFGNYRNSTLYERWPMGHRSGIKRAAGSLIYTAQISAPFKVQ